MNFARKLYNHDGIEKMIMKNDNILQFYQEKALKYQN